MTSRSDLQAALAVLMDLEVPSRARAAAGLLPDSLAVLDVLRASDGVQQLAQALDVHRTGPDPVPMVEEPFDPAWTVYS